MNSTLTDLLTKLSEHNERPGACTHITNFEWNTILEVADIIKEKLPCKIVPSIEIDTVQLNKRNEPYPYILNFWKPKISLKEGINKIINEMI